MSGKFQIIDDQGDILSFAPPAALTSLNAVTANGTGTAFDFSAAVGTVTLQVSTTGTPTGGTVTLMVSLDGVTWVASTTTATVTATPVIAHLANVAVRYVRCDLSALAGGVTPTVTAKVLARA